MREILGLRQETSKTFDLGAKRRQWHGSLAAVHYKDNYADMREPWKDIDLSWVDGRITKAPFELTHVGNRVDIHDKRTGKTGSIEYLSIGGNNLTPRTWVYSDGLARASMTGVAEDTDLEIVVQNTRVRVSRVLKTDKAPRNARFRITGDLNIVTRAEDQDLQSLIIKSSTKDGVLTENLVADGPVKYPIRVDPTWDVAAGNDDTTRAYTASYWELGDSTLRCGYSDAGFKDAGAAARFLNVTIPHYATIDSAIIRMTSAQNRTADSVNTRLRMQAADDPATFSDAADFDARTWTTAYTYWGPLGDYNLDVVFDSADFSSSVQEVVDRLGWSPGQAMVTLWDDWEQRSTPVYFTYRICFSYNGDPAKATQFIVTYTEMAPTVTTQAATAIGATIATGNGTITVIGTSLCTRRGFCYMVGTSGDPTTSDSVAYDDGSFDAGVYSKVITGLISDTFYRVRAYAVNATGTGYGDTIQIKTTLAPYPVIGGSHVIDALGAEQ